MTRSESGSVFIESMIAAAIVAMSLGSMYSALAESAQRDRLVEQKRFALLIAQSELAAVGSAIPLAPGVTGGIEGSYTWRVGVAPFGGMQPSNIGQLLEVSVSVRAIDGSSDLVTLRSLAMSAVS